MKKLVILFALIIAGFVIYPVINSYYLQSQLRDNLKTLDIDLSESNQQGDVESKFENNYPQLKLQMKINYDSSQIPFSMLQAFEQKMKQTTCDDVLKKIEYSEKDKRQAVVKVLREDQVSMMFVVMDKNQQELIKHEQKLIDCPNIQALEK